MHYEGTSIFGDPVPFGGVGFGADPLDPACQLVHGPAAIWDPAKSDCGCPPGFTRTEGTLWNCLATAGAGGPTQPTVPNMPLPNPLEVAKWACTSSGNTWDAATQQCKQTAALPPPGPQPGPQPPPAGGGKTTELFWPLMIGGAVVLGVIALSAKKGR